MDDLTMCQDQTTQTNSAAHPGAISDQYWEMQSALHEQRLREVALAHAVSIRGMFTDGDVVSAAETFLAFLIADDA